MKTVEFELELTYQTLEAIMKKIKFYRFILIAMVACYLLLKILDIFITFWIYMSGETGILLFFQTFQDFVATFIFGTLKIVMCVLFYKMTIRYLNNYLDTDSSLAKRYRRIIDLVMVYSILCFTLEFSLQFVRFLISRIQKEELPAEFVSIKSIIIGFSKKIMYLFQSTFIIAIFCFLIRN